MAHFNNRFISSHLMPKNYEIIEHTADIGIRVKAKSLKDLFKNTGLAIFELSSRRQFTRYKKHSDIIIKQKANTLEELFINWLNELLSVSSARGLIFHNIKIKELKDCMIEALCTGSSMENYRINIEIKAVTYHRLNIGEDKEGWKAEVILDV